MIIGAKQDRVTPNGCLHLPYYGSHYLRGYLQGAIDKGHDPQAILLKAELSPDVYDDPLAHLNGTQLLSLFTAITDTLDDVYLGFMQEPGKLAMQYEICRVSINSETLGDAICNLLRFQIAIRNDVVRTYGSDTPTHDFYIQFFNKNLKPTVDRHLFYFHRIASNYRYFSWLIGKRIKLTGVSFSTAEPAGGIDYQKYFNCRVRFNQKWDALRFDRSYLSFPVVRTLSELFETYFPDYPDWNTIPGEEQSLSRQIERMIRDYYKRNEHFPAMQQVAGLYKLTPRTLGRRLTFEGASFRDIKLTIKRELAEKLLRETELSIAKISDKLDFNEPGDFARSFQSWTGSTPTGYRKKHRHG